MTGTCWSIQSSVTARFGHPEWRQTLTLATRFLSSNQGSHSWCSAVRDTEGVRAACDRKQNRAGKQRKRSSFLHLSIILLFWLALVFGMLVAGFSHTTSPVHSLWPLPSVSASALLDVFLSVAWIFSWSEVQPNPATSPFKKPNPEDSSCFHLFANDI